MWKLVLTIGLFAAFVLFDPPRVLGYLGPGAHAIGYTIKGTLDLRVYQPVLRRIGL